jgi:hypothetical protein
MRLQLLAAAIAALALAGVAFAQDVGVPTNPAVDHQRGPPDAPSAAQTAVFNREVRAWKASCAADRRNFCSQAKLNDDLLRCLSFRPSKLSAPCHAATSRIGTINWAAAGN